MTTQIEPINIDHIYRAYDRRFTGNRIHFRTAIHGQTSGIVYLTGRKWFHIKLDSAPGVRGQRRVKVLASDVSGLEQVW